TNPAYQEDIVTSNALTILNAGTVSGAAVGVDLGGGGAVINNGMIADSSLFGVWFEAGGGFVNNSGTIEVTHHGARPSNYGVNLYGALGSIKNTGLIEGDTGVKGIGLDETLENAGTIIGTAGYAAYLRGSHSNRLIVDPGAVFGGAVEAANATATNTIE